MLTDEKIEALWVGIHHGEHMATGFNTFARAIEQAVREEMAKQENEYREHLLDIRDNLLQGMSKSIQKLQARAINETLGLPEYARPAPVVQEKQNG